MGCSLELRWEFLMADDNDKEIFGFVIFNFTNKYISQNTIAKSADTIEIFIAIFSGKIPKKEAPTNSKEMINKYKNTIANHLA